MKEYNQTPTEFAAPTEAELRARSRRSLAIAVGLLAFMVVVFLAMISRAGVI